MKRLLLIIASLLVTSLSQARERGYEVRRTIVHCKNHSEIYDAAGRLKDPDWYMNFENKLLTNAGKNYKGAGGVTENYTTLMRRQGDPDPRDFVNLVQFSHQFITTRPPAGTVGSMKQAGYIQADSIEPIVQVCRVYYLMDEVLVP